MKAVSKGAIDYESYSFDTPSALLRATQGAGRVELTISVDLF